MAFRVIEALIGVALAAGGGYLAWVNRGSVDGMFPPEPGLSVWTFVGGLVALIIGLVAAVHAMGPRPRAKARRVEEAQRRARILREAEQFYTAQAEELASPTRDPEKPLFPEGLRPAGAPLHPPTDHPANPQEQPPRPFQLHSLNQPPAPGGAAPGSRPPEPAEPSDPQLQPASTDQPAAPEPDPTEPETPEPAATPAPPVSPVAAAKTVVSVDTQPNPTPPESSPQPSTAPTSPPPPSPGGSARPFPAAAGVIPRAGEPPPLSISQTEARPPASNGNAAVAEPAEARSEFGAIRMAIAENRLEEADRLLSDTRKQLNETDEPKPVELAKLTGLAGDHAAADGRLGSAKWLWRLALQRFAAAGAIDDPAAREVSERMRLADQ